MFPSTCERELRSTYRKTKNVHIFQVKNAGEKTCSRDGSNPGHRDEMGRNHSTVLICFRPLVNGTYVETIEK